MEGIKYFFDMNTPNKSSTNSKSPEKFKINPFRAAIFLLLSAGIFVSGYFAGKGCDNTEKDLVGDNAKDTDSDKQANLKDKIDAMRNMRSVPSGLDAGDGVCDMVGDDDIIYKSYDLLDERWEKAAYDLIAKLGITNEKDKEAIIEAFLNGCTEVDEVYNDAIFLKNSSDNPHSCRDYVELEEEIEVPDEFISDYEKAEQDLLTNQEKELKQMIEDGRADEVVKDFDLDSIDFTDAYSPIEAEQMALMEKNLRNIQKMLSNTDDLKKRAEIVCKFMLAFANLPDDYDTDTDEEDEDSPPSRSALLFSMFLNAIAKSVGVEGMEDCFDVFANSPVYYNGNEVTFFE